MKKLVKRLTISVVVFFLFIISLLVFSNQFLPSSTLVEQVNCRKKTNLISLQRLKDCPKDILPAAREALSAFPKLHDLKIKFAFSSINSVDATMLAQPEFTSTLFNIKTKEFIIYINNNQGVSKGLNYTELSKDIQVGWIAHELGHILDYKERDKLSMIGLGVNYYLVPKFKQKIEHAADKIAINHGLGRELLAGVEYLLNHPNISDRYKKKFKKYYLSVDDIKQYIVQYESNCVELM